MIFKLPPLKDGLVSWRRSGLSPRPGFRRISRQDNRRPFGPKVRSETGSVRRPAGAEAKPGRRTEPAGATPPWHQGAASEIATGERLELSSAGSFQLLCPLSYPEGTTTQGMSAPGRRARGLSTCGQGATMLGIEPNLPTSESGVHPSHSTVNNTRLPGRSRPADADRPASGQNGNSGGTPTPNLRVRSAVLQL